MVGLFCPSDPGEWGLRSDRVKVFYKGLECRICFHQTCERGEVNRMKQLSVQEVYDASVQLLEAGILQARMFARSTGKGVVSRKQCGMTCKNC